MTNDTKAIMLLCCRLNGKSSAMELNQREYTRVVHWLKTNNLRPADLLVPANVIEASKGADIDKTRLASLMNRGVQLAFSIESWNSSGIWIVSRSDDEYPLRVRTHLKDKAPPIFYCSGTRSLLEGGGLAIVGSRNVDNEGNDFTQLVATACAREGMPIVSGGARGVDQVAMKSALNAGGNVIGILADKLLKNSLSRDARKAIADDQLLLMSPYHPEAHFTVGTAMGRNKLIYAMASYGLVVSADFNTGGTWAGAQEELKRDNSRPVFVRLEGSPPLGNQKLVDKGAIRFPEITEATGIEELLELLSTKHEKELLFKEAVTKKGFEELALNEPAITYQMEIPKSIYDAVLPIILDNIEVPVTAAELATKLDVSKAQLNKWLKRATVESQVGKERNPVRYMKLSFFDQNLSTRSVREAQDTGLATEGQLVYNAVMPAIIANLWEPITPEELAAKLDANKTQLNNWLKRADSEGKLKKLKKPVRYQKA